MANHSALCAEYSHSGIHPPHPDCSTQTLRLPDYQATAAGVPSILHQQNSSWLWTLAECVPRNMLINTLKSSLGRWLRCLKLGSLYRHWGLHLFISPLRDNPPIWRLLCQEKLSHRHILLSLVVCKPSPEQTESHLSRLPWWARGLPIRQWELAQERRLMLLEKKYSSHHHQADPKETLWGLSSLGKASNRKRASSRPAWASEFRSSLG